jgi:hypothetical protein
MSSRLLSKNINIKANEVIILLIALYGCQFLSPTLKEGQRLKVFEKKWLSRIFEPKWGEMIGDWRKLHSEEIHKLDPSPN